jgi:outer membrane protein assembly factor BamB
MAADVAQQYWPQWRGPQATGVAPKATPPTTWSENKNIRWKLPIPGQGHSTPVIWGDQLYLTAAVPIGKAFTPKPETAPGAHDNLLVDRRYAFHVLAIRRTDGKVLWNQRVHDAIPHAGGHTTASLASHSPVTDGKVVIASFGSEGLYCLDTSGKLLWKKDLGRMQTKHGHGEGASLVMHDQTVVINWDHEGESFILALDKQTGKQKWKAARDEPTSWATPIVVSHEGKIQLIVSGATRLRSYDLATGKVIWECSGLSHNVVASPVADKGMVYAGSSYEHQAMLAIRLAGAAGNITKTKNVVWKKRSRTPYVPSPLLYQGTLYYFAHYQSVLSRVIAATGDEPAGPFRIGFLQNIYASPVAAAGRIYITDLSGVTVVLSDDKEPKVLAVNRLADSFSASAALVDKELYLRGRKYLYSIVSAP